MRSLLGNGSRGVESVIRYGSNLRPFSGLIERRRESHAEKRTIKVFLATKFALKGLADGTRIFCNDPEYIRNAIDESLKRLQTDYVDLWYWFVLTTPPPISFPSYSPP